MILLVVLVIIGLYGIAWYIGYRAQRKKETFFDRHCRDCDIFNDPNSDPTYCFSCEKE
jgi:hypothetical protein